VIGSSLSRRRLVRGRDWLGAQGGGARAMVGHETDGSRRNALEPASSGCLAPAATVCGAPPARLMGLRSSDFTL
jgi:hypothetical protein